MTKNYPAPLTNVDKALSSIPEMRHAIVAFDEQMLSWIQSIAEELIIIVDDAAMDDYLESLDNGCDFIATIIYSLDHFVTIDHSDSEIQTYDDRDREWTTYVPERFFDMSSDDIITELVDDISTTLKEKNES